GRTCSKFILPDLTDPPPKPRTGLVAMPSSLGFSRNPMERRCPTVIHETPDLPQAQAALASWRAPDAPFGWEVTGRRCGGAPRRSRERRVLCHGSHRSFGTHRRALGAIQ